MILTAHKESAFYRRRIGIEGAFMSADGAVSQKGRAASTTEDTDHSASARAAAFSPATRPKYVEPAYNRFGTIDRVTVRE